MGITYETDLVICGLHPALCRPVRLRKAAGGEEGGGAASEGAAGFSG